MDKREYTELERLVIQWQQAGKDWVPARLKAEQLEEDQKPYLASLMNVLDDGEMSEAKLDRLARGSKEYRDYIIGMCLARAEALAKKVRYDGLGALIEAKRSDQAFERMKIEKGVTHLGG